MADHFIAVSWPDDPQRAAKARKTVRYAAEAAGLVQAFAGERIAVFATPRMKVLAIDGDHGVVLGTVFRKDAGATRIDRFDFGDADQIVRTGGQILVEAYWGDYVAFIEEGRPAMVQVLRDPSGATPCFHIAHDGLTWLFSSVELAARAGLIDAAIDWAFVADYLAYPGLCGARTGLAGVRELLAGTRLSRPGSGQASIDRCWSPWRFAAPDRVCADLDEAVTRVAEETQRCVGAWASQSGSILLQLSGGLDSSIVAICLGQTHADLHCVTLATPHPGADERAYAQAAADAVGARLAVARLDAGGANATRTWPVRLPRPGINVLQRCVDRAVVDELARVGADTVFTGGGGDGVFGYVDTAAPAADVLRVHGFGPTFARAVSDLAELHQCTLWRAARLAVKKAHAQPTGFSRTHWPFLSDQGRASIVAEPPWPEGPANALPGKREHIAGIMGLQTTSNGLEQTERTVVRHPLLSQPLVELCLTIPSWLWIAGGRNRAVARAAFAEALPPRVLHRRTKGDFTGFNADVFDRQRGALREHLLGGQLVARGLLDRPAIERFLAAPIAPRDKSYFGLFLIADMETWTRSWSPAT